MSTGAFVMDNQCVLCEIICIIDMKLEDVDRRLCTGPVRRGKLMVRNRTNMVPGLRILPRRNLLP
jgi:hypothetical protein